jgi:hypothetical protein
VHCANSEAIRRNTPAAIAAYALGICFPRNIARNVTEARTSIGRYFDFYNRRRPHASLDGTTPDQAYFTALPFRLAA